jgi:hypothetical protein
MTSSRSAAPSDHAVRSGHDQDAQPTVRVLRHFRDDAGGKPGKRRPVPHASLTAIQYSGCQAWMQQRGCDLSHNRWSRDP